VYCVFLYHFCVFECFIVYFILHAAFVRIKLMMMMMVVMMMMMMMMIKVNNTT